MEQIKEYKKLTSSKERLLYASEMMQNYLEVGAPLELNIAMKGSLVTDLQNKISSSELSPDLFNKLEQHCKLDLIDPYARFEHSPVFSHIKMQSDMMRKSGFL